MSEIGQENQQFELGALAMFEIQILFHLVSNVHHRLFKIYKKMFPYNKILYCMLA